MQRLSEQVCLRYSRRRLGSDRGSLDEVLEKKRQKSSRDEVFQ
jgi:hypothetical protein